MSIETTPVESTEIDLDTFASELFGQSKPATETTNSEEVQDEAEDSDAEEETTVETQSEEEADEADAEEEDDSNEAPEPKKKNRAQDRISELNAKWREEQRRTSELLAEVERLKNPQNVPTPTTTKDTSAPDPLDKNEDGTPKYRLGEFDPSYIQDLTAHAVKTNLQSYTEKEAQDRAQREQDAQRAEVVTEWNTKLEPARERYPDFQEKGQELVESLTGLTQDYEDYISATIMSMEYGPDVLYYLASNPDEAQAIVNAGPTKTAVALGRIEAKFAMADAEKTLARPKTSKAPTPPPANRGATAAKVEVAPDTDDLEAYSKAFFKKK
jgi:hypothetical protein